VYELMILRACIRGVTAYDCTSSGEIHGMRKLVFGVDRR